MPGKKIPAFAFWLARGLATWVFLLAGLLSLLILFGSAFFVFEKFYVPDLRRKAEARWVEIGRPMPEFEKNLRPIEENESLRQLTRDLHWFGVESFYKPHAGEPDPNNTVLSKEVCDFIEAATDFRTNQIDMAAKKIAYFDNHKADLDRLYQGILQREPPVWNLVLKDGMTLRVPSYLTARRLCQVIYVDSLYRLEHGDAKGAADAIAAGMKLTSNFRDENILIPTMIFSAIDRLFAAASARMPEDPEALKNLPVEVKARREQWRKAVQTEAWVMIQVADYMGSKPEEFKKIMENRTSGFHRYIRYCQSIFYADGARGSLITANQVSISEKAITQAWPDLGEGEMFKAASHHGSSLSLISLVSRGNPIAGAPDGWVRSWLRLNLSLLFREQAELISWSHARMQEGKTGNLGEPPSVVVPGSKWAITGDAATNSVTLKLTPAPKWTTENLAVDDPFFLLPLDGSRAWIFNKKP